MYHYCQDNDENILSYLSPFLSVAVIEPRIRNVDEKNFQILNDSSFEKLKKFNFSKKSPRVNSIYHNVILYKKRITSEIIFN